MVSPKVRNALKEAKETCNTILEVSRVCDKHKVSFKDREAICGYMRNLFMKKRLHEVFTNTV